MRLEEFALGESVIHRLDPRAKVMAALMFSVAVALNYSLLGTLTAGIFPALLVSAAGIGWSKVIRRMALVNGFLVFIWLFLPFTVPGETLYTVGPLSVHTEGLERALLITLKSNVILLAVIALLGTTPVFDLVHALGHMGVPQRLVHIFFFCFRYIHVIHDEYSKLLQAMKIRGFKPGTNLHTYRSYSYLVGMLLVRSFDRSHRILAAMKCRGFNGHFYILHHYNMQKSDIALTGLRAGLNDALGGPVLIRLEDVSFSYGPRRVLDGLNLAFNRGDRVGLIGRNGSGKTTLCHIIMGLVSPDAGRVEVLGKTLTAEEEFARSADLSGSCSRMRTISYSVQPSWRTLLLGR